MTPPRDRVFLADVGYPYLVLCHYNPINNDYVYTELQVDLYEGVWQDYYFQNEHCAEDEIKGWIELPKVKQ